MSRTRGHTQRCRKGYVCYRSAKRWRSSYNRQLRRANNAIASADDGTAAYLIVRQVRRGNKTEHPGDLW